MAFAAADPLAEGVHTAQADGITVRYHVHGSGPVCVAHAGGPGFGWEYLRAPELEKRLTMVYVEPVGTGQSGRLASHPHGYTRARYSRILAGLIEALPVRRVHLLGHSHGGFVAQYHAVNRPDQLAGVVLYDSAPVTGGEHVAEAMRAVQDYALAHSGDPGLAPVLEGFAAMPGISGDESMLAVARAVFPAYVADYRSDSGRWEGVRAALSATYISGLDERGMPDLVDDRAVLTALKMPVLVIAGRFDVVCGMRWARELHALIPDSRLAILGRSGHFGHLEEPVRFAEEVVAFVASTAEAPPPDAGWPAPPARRACSEPSGPAAPIPANGSALTASAQARPPAAATARPGLVDSGRGGTGHRTWRAVLRRRTAMSKGRIKHRAVECVKRAISAFPLYGSGALPVLAGMECRPAQLGVADRKSAAVTDPARSGQESADHRGKE